MKDCASYPLLVRQQTIYAEGGLSTDVDFSVRDRRYGEFDGDSSQIAACSSEDSKQHRKRQGKQTPQH